MPQVQVELQTKRTVELRQCKVDLSLLSSVGFQAGMNIGARASPVSLVRAETSWETVRLWSLLGREDPQFCSQMCRALG